MEHATELENKEAGEVKELQTRELNIGENIWIESYEDITGDNLEALLWDISREVDTDMLYIKRVGNHLEIGFVKKIEIIY